MSLPVEAYLGEIRRRVRSEGRLLLSAAPGAGKTSCVPGALAEEFPEGKILLVEPRRVAASAAAMRISALRGEQPGESAGFSVRGEHCIGKNTRIIAMTPGVLLRKIQEPSGSFQSPMGPSLTEKPFDSPQRVTPFKPGKRRKNSP